MGANNHLTTVPTNYHADDADAADPVADGGRQTGKTGDTPHLTVVPTNFDPDAEADE